MSKQAKADNLSIIIPTLRQKDWDMDYYMNIIWNLIDLWYWDAEIITIEWKLVNEAWNEWVNQATREYILVINDDIVIKEWTIERLKELLNYHLVSCPYFTRRDEEKLHLNNWNNNICWFCFMFKKEDRDLFFPIPETLKLWYWDNYIYQKSENNIWWWWEIHHFESRTLLSDEHKEYCTRIIEEDKANWELLQFIRDRYINKNIIDNNSKKTKQKTSKK